MRRKKGKALGDGKEGPGEAASRRVAGQRDAPGGKKLSNAALLHELQVHQVQLEMQNEALTKMQAELEESRNLYRDLYDSAPVGYLTLDHRTIVKGANRTAMTLLGAQPGDLELHGFGRFVAEPDLPRWDRHFRKVLRNGVKDSCVLRLTRPDGSGFSAQLDSIRREGGVGKFDIRTILTDVSDRERAERERDGLIAELEQRNRELDQFVSTVSHGLKSPLTTLRGFLSLVEEDAEGANSRRLREELSRVSGSARRMQEILDSLLQLSRVGKIVNPPEEVPFGTLVEEALDLVAIPLHERGVRVTVAPGLPRVFGDRDRLREVLVNLIENAVKFMGYQTKPRIEIGTGTASGVPAFYVKDNGIGIGRGDQARIFDIFRKLDGRSPGYGLGLALAKRIIEVHGGRIWVESEGPGKGSTFWFTIPGPSGNP